jgi:hypothetical protein
VSDWVSEPGRVAGEVTLPGAPVRRHPVRVPLQLGSGLPLRFIDLPGDATPFTGRGPDEGRTGRGRPSSSLPGGVPPPCLWAHFDSQMPMRHRLRQAQLEEETDALACPSYEDLRIQAVVMAYLLGEGRFDETIFELANRFSPDEGDAVERAVRDLVGAGVLSIDGGKVVPRLASLSGRHSE